MFNEGDVTKIALGNNTMYWLKVGLGVLVSNINHIMVVLMITSMKKQNVKVLIL